MKEFNLAQSWIVRALVFLMPLFFLPITTDFFEFNKMFLLAFGVVLAVLLWALGSTRGDFKFRSTPFDLPVLAFCLAAVASSVFATPNKLNAFLFPGTTTIIISLTLFYFLLTQYLRKNTDDNATVYKTSSLLVSLILGTSVAAVISLLAGVKVFSLAGSTLGLPLWLTIPTFNTLGGILPALTVFLVLLPIMIERVTKRIGQTSLNVGLLIAVVAGLAVSAFYVVSKDTAPRILPINIGWSILLETLKQNLLFGIGSGNFVEAFNRFRPVEFNATDAWNLRFGVSSNLILDVWTTMGLAGLGAFLWIITSIFSQLRGVTLRGYHYSLLLALVLFLLVPSGVVLLTIFYILLAHMGSPRGRDVGLQFAATQADSFGTRHKTNFLPGVIALVSLAGLLVGGYYTSRVYTAETYYRAALDATLKNDIQKTYENLTKAIQANPYVDFYRSTFAQTNLAIANAMAANQNVSDADKQTIAQLVQQAIREGQAAVADNRTHAENWDNLARIYQAIIPVAQGADQYAVASFQQAIVLDPVNPLTRVSLGGVFYSLKDYPDAIKVFELATATKPDYANAHYNLAIALRDNKDLVRAGQEMAAALSLTDKDTPGYEQAKKEFDELQKKVNDLQASAAAQQKATGAGSQDALQPASQVNTIKTPVNLGAESAPPATEEAQPTPIPAPTVSAAPGTAQPTPAR